jgi:pimeloyl-ACP methyl ester carboxylesterase
MWRSFCVPDFDLTGRAPDPTAPTLIVWGRRDPVIPLRYAKVANRLVPNAGMAVLDTGHMPFSSAPEDFLKAVWPFLRCVQAAAG